MIEASDVFNFANRLHTPVDEKGWQAEWSKKVADEMRANAPVATGALRGSIRVAGDGVEVGVRYAAYVEYGTARTSPQPFAGPAVARLAGPAAQDIGKDVIDKLT